MSDLDPVIHAPARLRIVTALNEALSDGDEVTFPTLQKLLAMTAGNLTTHLGKLEAAGYIEISKVFVGRKPTTFIGLTHAGRDAFCTYRRQLLDLLGGNTMTVLTSAQELTERLTDMTTLDTENLDSRRD